MIDAKKIADVIGLKDKIHSLFDLNELVAEGLPRECLSKLAEKLTSNSNAAKYFRERLIPSLNDKRRESTLNAYESERIERIARIYVMALDIWSKQEDAQQFLFSAHPLLKNKTPIDISFTESGARQVEKILENIRFGLPV